MTSWQAPVDLDNCATEPIHIPGAIQPHGLLFAVTEPDLVVAVASANVAGWLGCGDDIVGAPLGVLLGEANTAAIDQARQLAWVQRHDELPLAIDGRPFTATLSRTDGYLLVELEPADDDDRQASIVREASMALQLSRTVVDVAEQAATWIRELTGFDRVMVYRFDAEWNGEVIAEAKIDSLNSFLGLHYPSTDIPAQARELYRRNWLRIIPDISYRPVPLVPPVAHDARAPLDLSSSTLRSVSPIHVEYLSNMGVDASMSVSILVAGELWGLIACHHYSGPHRPGVAVRNASEYLAQLISLRVADTVEADTRREAIELAAMADRVAESFATVNQWGVAALLEQHTAEVLALAGADGVVISAPGALEVRLGAAPTPADLVRIVDAWPVEQDVLVHDHVSSIAAAVDAATTSGVLVLALTPDRSEYVMWSRRELIHLVDWGGDPHNAKLAATEGEHVRLSPRRSFERWRETVRGRSRPWTDSEVRAAFRFARHLSAALRRGQRDAAALAVDLQRIMRPAALPATAAFRFDAFYQPSGSGGIGGDWYDAFKVGDGSIAAVIGDVTGHGLPAASDMSQLRNALRAYLVDDPSPALALTRLDRLIHDLLPGSIATVVCAVIDVDSSTMRISHAGHPPALVVGADGPAYVELDGDPLLGLLPDRPRHDRVIDLADVEAIVLYSDGLIETRRRNLLDGMDALLVAAATMHDDVAGTPTSHLAAQLVDPEHEDDVTTLVIHRPA